MQKRSSVRVMVLKKIRVIVLLHYLSLNKKKLFHVTGKETQVFVVSAQQVYIFWQMRNPQTRQL